MPYEFDEVRYRAEVLDAGTPVTGDLRVRYQLPRRLDGPGVTAAVTAVRACWRRSRGRLKYRAVVDELEAGHLAHRALFDAAAGGDLGPLRAALDAHGRQSEADVERLRTALTEAADGLGLLAPGTLAEAAAAHRADEPRLRALLPGLGLRVTEPDPLPPTAPHPAYARGRRQLEVLGLRHLADFLAAAAPGGRAARPVRVFGGPGPDRAELEAAARRWGRLPHGTAHTAAQTLVAAVRAVHADEGSAGLVRLLLYDVTVPLRERRAARAAAGSLLAYATGELGIVEADARRLVFAVLHEEGADPVAVRLGRLVADGRLVEAAAVADRLPPGTAADLVTQVRATLAQARALVDRARALPPAESDRAWDLIERAEAIVRDLPGVDAARRDLAVAPVPALTAAQEGPVIVVTWDPTPSTTGEPTHVLIRAAHHRPRTLRDGVPLTPASPRATSYEDRDPPPNVPLYYAVAARRGAEPDGAVSELRVFGPLVHRPEVAELHLRAGDAEVAAAWTCPAGADSVDVVRSAPGAPDVAVPAHRDGFTDSTLINGTAYTYRIRVVHRDDDGRPVRTDGIRRTVTPQGAPEPVAALTVGPAPDEPGRLLARFTPPRTGTVLLYGFDAEPPWTTGTRIPAGALPAQPLATAPDPEGLRLVPPQRPTVVLAVTVADDRAVTGGHALACAQTLGTPRLARHGASGPLVVFAWPQDAGDEAELVWRVPGTGAEHRRTVTRAAYEQDTGVPVPEADGAGGLDVEVRPVVRLGGLRAHGTTTRAHLAGRTHVDYRLVRAGLPGRRTVTAEFTAQTPVRAHRLLLVVSHGRGWPLDAADGTVLAEAHDVLLAPGARLTAPLPRGRERRWLRCFAEPADGTPLVLRDPPQGSLKLGKEQGS
ncbi:hypothetical protein ACIBUY_02855 [Streptomyces sp. NPDC050085]|uniref:hypothetical protein n=1 Tax=Streptomyces sp. NPDC050085 TaxID=3365600 RepID=UPI00379032ED